MAYSNAFLFVVAFLVASGGSVVEARWYGRPGKCSPVEALVSEQLYSSIFLHKDDAACPAKGFYTYSSFIRAARTFPKFAGTGDLATRKREIAAFFAQISHETTGGWATAPDGPYAWGLCYKEEISPASNYCDATDKEWPCYPGKSYHGRGPIQISWNFNYGPAGRALGFDGLRNPEVVANCSNTAFRTALWFWMTPRRPKPSCHEVMVGEYRPTGVRARHQHRQRRARVQPYRRPTGEQPHRVLPTVLPDLQRGYRAEPRLCQPATILARKRGCKCRN